MVHLGKIIWLLAAAIICTPAVLFGGTLDLMSVQKEFQHSLVDVIFNVQYDKKGEVPQAVGLFCARCSDFHYNNLEQVLADSRLVQVTGFLTGEKTVIAPDLMIDPGGFDRIFVRLGKHLIEAKVTYIYPDQGAVQLELVKAFPDGKVLQFVPAEKSQFFAYSRIMEMGRWVCRLSKFDTAPAPQCYESGIISGSCPGNALIVNSSGKPVAILGNNNEILSNLSWDLSWEKWRKIPVKEYEMLRAKLIARLRSSLVPATVYFREWQLSRREKIMGTLPLREFFSYVYRLPDGKVILPLLTTPQQNGRIEKIVVHLPQGDVVAQPLAVNRFFGGIFLSWKPEWKLPAIADQIVSMNKEAGNMVWSVDIKVFDKKLAFEVKNDALGAVMRTYQNVLSGNVIKKGAPDLLFSLSGNLLGVNLDVRAFNYSRIMHFIDVGELNNMFRRSGWIVPFKSMSNAPDAMGYLGVEYQPVNSELARSMNLAHLTNYGNEGLLITHVYSNSPAAKMGLKNGDVLIKLIVPRGGAPIRLTGKAFAVPQAQQFPWEKLDAIPEQYFSEIPEPWNGVKNPLNERLSAIGIGRDVVLIAICDGKLQRKAFKIAAAPVRFETAKRYRSAALGLEVRDITFELQHYFRMKNSQSGVIVSEVAAGSSAATAGVRPFEIITAVNDRQIHSAEEFKNAVTGTNDVRLNIRRLAVERVVTVKPAFGPRRK